MRNEKYGRPENAPQMVEAKEATHTIYEIKDAYSNGNISLSENVEQPLHKAAYKASLEGASFSASSLDMSSALDLISHHFQEGGANWKLLSEKTRKMITPWYAMASGLSSQDTNVRLGSSNEGIGGRSQLGEYNSLPSDMVTVTAFSFLIPHS